MSKKEVLFIMVGVWSLFFWGLALMILCATGKVTPTVYAFTADECGTLCIAQGRNIVIIDTDGNESTFKSPLRSPRAMEMVNGMIVLKSSGRIITVDIEGTVRENTLLPEDQMIMKKLFIPDVQLADGTVYHFIRLWGRYSIIEAGTTGVPIIRYQMPLRDYIVMLLSIVYVLCLAAFSIGLLLHFIVDHRITKRGYIVPRKAKSKG